MKNLNTIENIDCLVGLKKMPDESVDCCVTSPPYFGLRDYGHADQIGLEETPEAFVAKMVGVFTEVRRVLKKEGTLWLNLGDSFAGSGRGANENGKQGTNKGTMFNPETSGKKYGLKTKDLIGIPWMVAFALRSSGWYLRQDIIWHKKNCMPESVKDRCTKNHEYIFLLTKSNRYYFDSVSIQEDAVWDVDGNGTLKRKLRQRDENKSNPDTQRAGIRKVYTDGKNDVAIKSVNGKRNKRSVWSYPTAQFPEAHFATFPEDLIVDYIKAGCPPMGIVLDPFMGAGTTALVAAKLGRNFIGFELNPDYIKIAEKRLKKELGMFHPCNDLLTDKQAI